MAIRANGYNNPEFAAAASELAKAFAPPSGADAYGFAKAKSEKADAARLAEAFSMMTNPASDRATVDRFGIASGRYNPNASYYAVDASNATSRSNNAADNELALQQTMLTPLSTGQTRFVPQELQQRFALPAQQTGIIEADQGKVYHVPGQEPIAGPSKPLSRDEYLAQVLQTMQPAEQQAAAFGTTPIEAVMQNGKAVNVTRPQAIGAEPVPDASKTVKPTNGTYLMRDGRRGPAFQQPGEGIWRDAQSGQPLPPDVEIFDTPKPEGTAEQVGLTKPVMTDAQKSLTDLTIAKGTLGRLRTLVASSPASQGVVGWLRGTAQDLIQTGGEMGAFFGGRLQDIDKAIESGAADAGIKSSFDPNIPAIEMLANLLAFQYAKTTTGERLSNEMLQASRRALGLEGLTANQSSAIARLNEAENAINRQEEILRNSISQGVQGLRQPTSPSPAPSATAPGGNKPMPSAESLRAQPGDMLKDVNDAAGTQPQQEQRFESNVLQKWGRDANGKPVRLQ